MEQPKDITDYQLMTQPIKAEGNLTKSDTIGQEKNTPIDIRWENVNVIVDANNTSSQSQLDLHSFLGFPSIKKTKGRFSINALRNVLWLEVHDNSLVKAFKYDAANIKPNGGQTSLIASTSNQQPLISAGTIPFLQAATALPPPASSYVSNVNSPIPQVSMQSVTTESFGLPNGGVPP
ncbi:hypothetical protein Tco_0128805 [Tanacetum coccineum]